MSNGSTRSVTYTPRMTSLEGYDRCHPTVKKALQASAFSWDGYWCYRQQMKHGAAWVIRAIARGDRDKITKGWKLSSAFGAKNVPTPNKKPLPANW